MRKLIITMVLILAGLVATITESSAQTMYACVSIKNRAMRYVGTSPVTCTKGEVLISWNQAGPTGPTGPQGPPGVANGLSIAYTCSISLTDPSNPTSSDPSCTITPLLPGVPYCAQDTTTQTTQCVYPIHVQLPTFDSTKPTTCIAQYKTATTPAIMLPTQNTLGSKYANGEFIVFYPIDEPIGCTDPFTNLDCISEGNITILCVQ
jgi:hypothetical protein